MNPLLFGNNTDTRIVAVHQKDDRTMRIYFRADRSVRHEDVEFFPFFYLTESTLLDGFSHKHWLKQLDGTNALRFLCVFEEWSAMWDGVRHVIDRVNLQTHSSFTSYTEVDKLFLYADPVAHYLMQSGRTLFKEMTLNDVHRMQLDIETYTGSSHRFSNAQRSTDRIILIALSDNYGWQHLIDGKKLDEREMLLELVRIMQEKDPDVIEGHNIYNFDLPYIIKRCDLHKVQFKIGRDESTPRSFNTRASFADRAYEYIASDIAGRHIIDTMLLVQSYDMMKRNMESYGLKYAAQYFGFASPSRTYIPGDKISWHWDNDPKPLMDYAMDDVTETRKLSEQLSGTTFHLTQMLPFNYGLVARMGSAAKIESLMIREYLRAKHSIPQPSSGTQTTGGYTDIFVTGIVGPVVHADVESLYPSIIINNKIIPSSDTLGIFNQLLAVLTNSRLETKRQMLTIDEVTEKARLDAMQSSLKILINSFYGYLGYIRGLFNDFSQADVVTTTGQSVLRQMIEFIQSQLGTVIEVDTDGIFFVPPPSIVNEEEQAQFVERLTSQLPKGIRVAMSGRYEKMLSYKIKNYALLEFDGTMIIRGSSLISRSIERFGRTYIRQCIECLLHDDIDGLHAIYSRFRNDIIDHKLNVREFTRRETLKGSLADYERDVLTGKRNKNAAYQIALATQKGVRTGDAVYYYITGVDPNVKTHENCRPASEWDPNFPDENTEYYLRRLDEFSEKFKDFFTPQDFRAIFSPDDLFSFSSDGIQPVVRTILVPPPPNENDLEEQGIWLDG